LITEFQEITRKSGFFTKRRAQQNTQWFENLIAEAVLHRFYQQVKVQELLPRLKEEVAAGKIPVALAVDTILKNSEE